ncbi:hypothetical protein ACFVMC_28475 [Nocardia sp. NPDC127579]|uniref:hypothetical protein n=1 Tax=Nocardia sp. NPDC127579 TaxID=3345402 RepID=UPI0036344C5A
MDFDEKRYVEEVLTPARRAGNLLPALEQRYQIGDLSGRRIAERADEVRAAWRRARKKAQYAVLVDRMMAEHADLEAIFAAARAGDDSAIKAAIRAEREELSSRSRGFGEAVTAVARVTGRVAPAIVEQLARQHGLVRESAFATAGALPDVRIGEPDLLPAVPPIRTFGTYSDALRVLDHRHTVDFVFEERHQAISVFDRFAVGRRAGLRIDDAQLERVRRAWEERPRDHRSTHADTVRVALHGVVAEGHDAILKLLQYEIAEYVRDRRRSRTPEDRLLEYLVGDLGIDRADGKRVVFAVMHEDLAVGASPLFAQLQDLMAAGEVYAAAQLVANSAPVPPDAQTIATLARERVAQAEELCARIEPGRADPVTVDLHWGLWKQAQDLAADLPALPRLARLLAPAPVTDVVAAQASNGVVVTWRGSRSQAGEISYRVLVGRDRAPSTELEAERTVGETGTRSVLDGAPPVNSALHYAVLAERDGIASTLAVASPIVLRPEPDGIGLQTHDLTVSGRWTIAPEADRVVVRRREVGRDDTGVEIPCQRDGFLDRGVRNGIAYRYHISAVYLDGDGAETRTAGTFHTVQPSSPPEPVRELDFDVDNGRLDLSYTQPAEGVVQFFGFESGVPWPFGAGVPIAELTAAGRRLPGRAGSRGMTLELPDRALRVVAVSIGGESAVIGADIEYLPLAPLRGLRAGGAGDQVTVSWHWPEELASASVEWWNGDQRRLITASRAQYERDGAIRFDVDRSRATVVAVRPIARLGGIDRVGAPQRATVPAISRVSYTLTAQGLPWRRELVLELRSATSVSGVRFILGQRAGTVMPVLVEQCARVLELVVDIAPDAPVRRVLSLPAGPKPFWLRGFVEGDAVELADPPVDQLRRGRR